MAVYPAGTNAFNVNDRYMWGGSIYKMQWLPMPSTGLTANKTFDDNLIQLENGGAQVVRSRGYHVEYDLSWAVREAQSYGGLDLYAKYASGYYAWAPSDGDGGHGDNQGPNGGSFYFANPMNFTSNLMAPQWATPMLCTQAQLTPGILPSTTGFLPLAPIVALDATVSNDYDQPVNTNVFNTIGSAATDKGSVYANMVIPIPPTHSLHLGFSGSVTGTGAIGIMSHKISDGSIVNTRVTSLLNAADSTRLDAALTISGADYDWACLFVSSTGVYSDAGTVSLTSSVAQLWPTGTTPNSDGGQGGNHIAGEGNTGLSFTDSAMAETYVQVVRGENRHYKGLTTKLVEVEAWLP